MVPFPAWGRIDHGKHVHAMVGRDLCYFPSHCHRDNSIVWGWFVILGMDPRLARWLGAIATATDPAPIAGRHYANSVSAQGFLAKP